MSDWISVEDRLPAHDMVFGWDGDYQFCMMIGGKLMAHYDDASGWETPKNPVTHWMPLPEPPSNKT